MNSDSPHPNIATARIVSPEESALDSAELAFMRIVLAVARKSGVPHHLVRFDDGITALVIGDPNDTEAWLRTLAKVHQAAIAGQLGPVHTEE